MSSNSDKLRRAQELLGEVMGSRPDSKSVLHMGRTTIAIMMAHSQVGEAIMELHKEETIKGIVGDIENGNDG